jgi:hypothetical protein
MGGKARRERVMATRGGEIPLCKGANYHVFDIGANKCSVCGWDRFLNQHKTCARCGETWNDCLVDHECKTLSGIAHRVQYGPYGEEGDTYSMLECRLSRAIVNIDRIVRTLAEADSAVGSVNVTLRDLARRILDCIEEK